MALGRHQKEVLKLHRVWRRPRAQLDALALAEEHGHRVSQLHLRKVDADARPGTHTEGVEGQLGFG